METYGSGKDICAIGAGGTRLSPARSPDAFRDNATFKMDGKAAFKLSAEKLPNFLQTLFAKARMGQDDLALVVPHQASALALNHIVKRLQIPVDKVVNIFSTFGNQIAASIPTALNHAITNGRLNRGDKVMLIGTSAGISIGALILEY